MKHFLQIEFLNTFLNGTKEFEAKYRYIEQKKQHRKIVFQKTDSVYYKK